MTQRPQYYKIKNLLFLILFSITSLVIGQENNRIETIKNNLEILKVEIPGLTEQAKLDININNITLSNFILAISNAHEININIDSELNQIHISSNNFSNVTVSDLLIFLCKEFSLTIDFTGSILSLKKYSEPVITPETKPIPVQYNSKLNTISIEAKNENLYEVFKSIMDESNKNLVFEPKLESSTITCYIKDLPFDNAMNSLAISNNLYFEKKEDGFYVFQNLNIDNTNAFSRQLNKNPSYTIIDIDKKMLKVEFHNTPISEIIENLSHDLNLNIFTASPLDRAGNITFKADKISFDHLLIKIFEPQRKQIPSEEVNQNLISNNRPTLQNNNSLESTTDSSIFTFKKENNIYYFGTINQLSVRKTDVIYLKHRSVELLTEPAGGSSRNRTVGSRNNTSFNTSFDQNYNTNYNNSNNNSNRNRPSLDNNNSSNYNSNEIQTIKEIIPVEVAESLDIKIDHELNCLYVTGSSEKIERLKDFITYIDKTVPVVLIEVMFIEVNKNNTIEAGVTWGIGEEPIETTGQIFPETILSIGAQTINNVINGFSGFGSLNLGKVVPNFFATIKAMENNGNLSIKSTPKLSTLNGHRATFSNGETSYYAVTQRNIYGTDNPQTSEITNYEPIDAELGLTIKPLVSGDGQVTLDIFVIQSSFGSRIDENAPPNISSREFSSIIRVQDEDIIVLGGLEEEMKNNTGSGVPLLSRIPIIKWLFSSRKREASKSKLTVFIKPTIIY